MKVMLPSMKPNKRYLVFEAVQKEGSFEDAKKSIMGCVNDFIGQMGLAQSCLSFLPDWKNGRGILSIERNSLDKIRASLCLSTSPKIRCIGVSGTLKKARERYLI